MVDPVIIMIDSAVLLVTGLLLSPFLDGLRRVLRAKVQRRIGPPIMQTFYDLRKLFSLDPILPSSNRLFIAVPFAYFSLLVVATMLLPLPLIPSLSVYFDYISLFYILMLTAFILGIAGLIVPNPYSNAGSVREFVLLTILEAVTAATLVGISIDTGTLNLYRSINTLISLHVYLKPSTLLLGLSLFIIAYVESGFTPFDIPEAETEVLGGSMLEYSGYFYGFLHYGFHIKRFILVSLAVIYSFLPPIAMVLVNNGVNSLLGGLIIIVSYVLLLILVYALYSIIEALNPRYRIDLALKPVLYYSIVPLTGVVLGCLGW